MARPVKTNAEWFQHKANDRDKSEVKALRRKFGLEGYAIYMMILEYLTDAEDFQFKDDEMVMEMIAGDFNCTPEILKDVLKYCASINLLQRSSDGFWMSIELIKRLVPLLSKRKRDREGVSDSENAHSTKQKSKAKESIGEESRTITLGLETDFWIIVDTPYASETICKVFDLSKYFERTGQLETFQKMGWAEKFDGFMKQNPAATFKDGGHIYAAFRKFAMSDIGTNVSGGKKLHDIKEILGNGNA